MEKIIIFLYVLYDINLQFWPNEGDIQPILTPRNSMIFTKFHNDWVNIVDFLLN